MDLTGRRIIVTGGAQGIGAGLVAAFVAAGARVGVVDIQPDAAAAVARDAAATGPGTAYAAGADVADRGSVEQAFTRLTDPLDGLDVLVHAAGINDLAPSAELDTAAWDRVLAVNARGTLHTNQCAFHALRDHGGAIVNFASGAGVRGYPAHGHYAASKGAVLSWTRTAAMEWAAYGITVNAVCPGIRTPMYERTRSLMTAEQLQGHDARLRAVTPIDGRLGDVYRDLAPVVAFLASPGARYVTGQTIPVDGGRTTVR